MNKDNESVMESKKDEARLKELYLASRNGEWTWHATGTVFGFVGAVVAAFWHAAVGWSLGIRR